MSDPLLDLIRANVQRGQFKLASGKTSDWFVDMQAVLLTHDSVPRGVARRIAVVMLKHDVPSCAIGGPGIGGALLVAAQMTWAAMYGEMTGFVVRPEPDRNGHVITGPLDAGMRCVLLDDVATSGRSLLHACHEAEKAGATVVLVIAVVDRGEGASASGGLEGAGYRFVSLYTREDLMDV